MNRRNRQGLPEPTNLDAGPWQKKTVALDITTTVGPHTFLITH